MNNLRQLVFAGAKQKALAITDDILNSLNHELEVIENKEVVNPAFKNPL